MISECFNPSCRHELMYLQDGRVIVSSEILKDFDSSISGYVVLVICNMTFASLKTRPFRSSPRSAADSIGSVLNCD
jgi:hypothetical protein